MGVSMTEAEQAEFLGTHGVMVLATVTDGGRPVPLPVWYVVVDGQLYVRTPRSSKRLHHIGRNPRVAALVHDGEAWRDLRGVLVSGVARIVDDEGEAGRVKAIISERFSALLPPPLPDAVAAHYDQTVILRIEPDEQARTWDNRKIRL